jgi:hypothetical protein
MPVWNAEPNARRNGSWLSTAYVSHEPLEMKGREKGGTVRGWLGTAGTGTGRIVRSADAL